MKLSFRDRTAYLGQAPNVPSGGPVTSTPDAPFNSPEMVAYTGLPQNQYFCPKCKGLNLFINIDKGEGDCNKCQGRFSLKDAQQGNSFPSQAGPRNTGLLDGPAGSNSMPSAHYTSEYGSGSASQSWGNGKS